MSDMTRKEAIEILKDWDGYFIGHNSDDVNEALDMAIASLETDEAYQLEYEKTTKPTIEEFIEYAQKEFGVIIKAEKSDNPDTYEKLFGTTKNDLGVDAISRQAINGYIDYILSHGMGKKKSFDFIKKFVANLTPVTPIRPKGHWILTDVEGSKVWRCSCSNCNKDPIWFVGGSENWWLIRNNLPKYCPSCGADMREVVEE